MNGTFDFSMVFQDLNCPKTRNTIYMSDFYILPHRLGFHVIQTIPISFDMSTSVIEWKLQLIYIYIDVIGNKNELGDTCWIHQ